MSDVTIASADATVRPFRFEVPPQEIEELRAAFRPLRAPGQQ